MGNIIYMRPNRAAHISCVGPLSPTFICNLPFWIKNSELQTTARRCRWEDFVWLQSPSQSRLLRLRIGQYLFPIHLSTFRHPDNIKSALKKRKLRGTQESINPLMDVIPLFCPSMNTNLFYKQLRFSEGAQMY